MDPQTLPIAEQQIYNKIKEQYKVRFEPFKSASGPSLNLLKITDYDQFINDDNLFAKESSFPFWVRLWEASDVLGNWFASQKLPPETRILELGCGLGVPGLIAAANGCKVVLSDYEDIILDFARVNVAASGIKPENIDFQLLNWFEPGEIDSYDLIIGAEIVFREDFFQPLLNIMKKALKPGGVIILAHDVRRKSLYPFLQQASKQYNISAQRKKIRNHSGEIREIILNRLKLK